MAHPSGSCRATGCAGAGGRWMGWPSCRDRRPSSRPGSPTRRPAPAGCSGSGGPRGSAALRVETATHPDHCLRSRNYVNVVVAGKQPAPQWLTMDEAVRHCEAGLGIWEWASNDRGGEPDVVMACCGDVPTLETLAAVELLRQHAPDLKIRVINVV